MTLCITLPWPPTELSPNKRLHWARLAKFKAKYREACRIETLRQLDCRRPQLGDRLAVLFQFLPPDRRSYDRDNLTARIKAGIDGMCDALGIDDKRIKRQTTEVVESVVPAKGAACVRVSLAAFFDPPVAIERDADGMPTRLYL